MHFNRFYPSLFSLILLVGCAGTGGEAVIEKRAGIEKRIISTAPSFAETIYFLGLEDDVVAVSEFCYFPEKFKSLPKIGGLYDPNLELMLSLKPDYIIALPSLSSAINEVDYLKDKMIVLQNETTLDILNGIDSLGHLFGREAEADSIVAELKNVLLPSFAGDTLSVMLVVSRKPGSLEDIYIAGGETYLSEFLNASGFRNIFNNTPTHYMRINLEVLLQKQPDVIIETEMVEADTAFWQIKYEQWDALPTLKAFKNRKIYRLKASYTHIPGIRVFALKKYFDEIYQDSRK